MSSAVHHSGSAGEPSLSISGWPRLLNPVGQVPDKVKEEIFFLNADDFIGDLDKEAEAFAGLEVKRLSYVLTEVLCSD